jgi:hypothetical protein
MYLFLYTGVKMVCDSRISKSKRAVEGIELANSIEEHGNTSS